MSPLVLTLAQGLLLLLLYVFVWRAVRAVVRELRSAPRAAPAAAAAVPADDGRPEPGEVVVHRPGQAPQVIPLDGVDLTFGRSESASVPLDDSYVSDLHARISHDGTSWVVEDLGSTNGTYLNSQQVQGAAPLAAGDQIALGQTTLEVRR